MRFVAAILASVLSLRALAMTGAEYAEFRRLITATENELLLVEDILSNAENLARDADGFLADVEKMAEEYTGSIWDKVDEKYRAMKESLDEWKAYYQTQYADVLREFSTLHNKVGLLDDLAIYNYRNFADLDGRMSEWLGVLATIPISNMATKSDFAKAFGYYGILNYGGYTTTTTIDFECKCVVKYPDAEYYAALEVAEYYLSTLLLLTEDFENLEKTEIPQ